MSEGQADTGVQSGAPPEGVAPGPGRRERKPPSPEQAARAAATKRAKRSFEKLLESGDVQALEAASRALSGEGTTAAPVVPMTEGTATTAMPEGAPVKPGPTPEETAAMVPLANALVANIAMGLAGTPYDPMRAAPNPLGGEPIVPAKALVDALAPVMAKYLPQMITTPEGQLALATLMWLGPPTVELVKARYLPTGPTVSADGAGHRAA